MHSYETLSTIRFQPDPYCQTSVLISYPKSSYRVQSADIPVVLWKAILKLVMLDILEDYFLTKDLTGSVVLNTATE